MKRALLFLISAGLLLAACKKPAAEAKEEAASVISAEDNAKIEAELIPPPTTSTKPGAPAVERLQGAVHPGLTARLQAYIDRTGQVPETIYEFANTAVDSMPPAPAGMKYVIDPADRTVKAVRK
jgi:hypothetical protein